MSKTNFDDLDLAVPGIEADEINAEGAALGSSLKVGLNGVMEWGPSASVVVAEHSSEATIAHGGGWYPMTDSQGYEVGPGWSVNQDGNIVAGPELDGRKMLFFVSAGAVTSGIEGFVAVQLTVQHAGAGLFYTFPRQTAVLSDHTTAVAFGFGIHPVQAGDVFKTQVMLYSTTGGTGDLDVEAGRTMLIAI